MSLDEEVSCNPHPDAPHGFLRNASHNADRYVCECEHWEEPKMREPIAWLNPDPDYEQICPEIGYEATYCEQHPKDLGWIPLYAQRDWVGLTGPEVDEAYLSVSDKEWAIGGLTDARVFFCAIEAKLKEKNT